MASLSAPLGRRLTRCSQIPYFARFPAARSFATKRDSASSLLAQGLEGAQTSSSASGSHRSSVGPFPLGVQPINLQGPKAKPWSELSTSGKVARTAARTTNLTVILIGAGLSVALTYALATELFAKNSPTRLYSDACENIKESESLKSYLPGPLSFHTTPPSIGPSRHRNRHPSSHLAVDSQGREHLLLHFWVTSAHLQQPKESESWAEWLDPSAWDLEWDEEHFQRFWEGTKATASETFDSVRRSLAYISGAPVPTSPPQLPSVEAKKALPSIPEDSGWNVFGMFRNIRLRGLRRSNSEPSHSMTLQWDTGEVHADFIKDNDGVFQCRYLLVDVPGSRVPRPIRHFVKKGQGFTERDGVFLW